MSQSSHRSMSDRNLLFGILAVQMSFVSRHDLVAGMSSWVQHKDKALGQILLEQGRLTVPQVQGLEALVSQYVTLLGGNVALSLKSLAGAGTAASGLTPIDDEDVRSSLACALDTDGAATGSDFAPGDVSVTATRDYPPPQKGVRYRRGLRHAGGGQGDVFFAYDTELHREVALKELKPKNADDAEHRLRFLREAEITGGLMHPGIVPVYGLGFYEDGRPYYAMRFIRGDNLKEAITRFHAADQKPGRDAAQRSLEFRQLLRRFIDVCNTVAYAHSRGMLHRDLKPANIMLGKFGETLVVDWGLAKPGGVAVAPPTSVAEEPALQPEYAGDLDKTQAGAFLGTASYTSPEQAAGRLDLIGQASDIYSLGATLYTLLTGAAPYGGKTTDEILPKVRRGEFAPPSALKPGTPAALDAICRKAMALQMNDRYATALDLAADVEHWLADEAVSAYREPWTARMGRWARRHQKPVAGATAALAVALVLAVVGGSLIAAEQRKTAEQKRIAEENFLVARQQLFSSIDLIETAEVDFATVPALHNRRKALLVAAASDCRKALAKDPDDREMRQRSAMVYRYSANLHRLVEDALSADRLYRDSIQLYEKLAAEDKETLEYQSRLAETLRDYASLQFKLGKLSAAAASLDRAHRIVMDLPAMDRKDAFRELTLATILTDQSAVAYSMGKDAESRLKVDQGAAILRKLVELPAGQGHPYDPLLLAGALNRIAVSERDAGRLPEARLLHAEAVQLLDDLLQKRPARVVLSDILNFRAICRLEQARTLLKVPDKQLREDAETNLGLAAEQWEGLATNYLWIPHYRERWAIALQTRGQLRLEDKRHDLARKDFEKSKEILDALVKAHGLQPAYRAELGKTYAGLGRLERALGNKNEAGLWFDEAVKELDVARKQAPDNAHHRRSFEEAQAEKAKG